MRAAALVKGYATCAAPLVPLYARADWEVADATEITGEASFFLLRLRVDEGAVGRWSEGYGGWGREVGAGGELGQE